MDMSSIGRYLIVFGIAIVIIGAVVLAAGRFGISLGRLPGDLQFEWGNVTCMFPLVSSIIISILLSVILNVILRFLQK